MDSANEAERLPSPNIPNTRAERLEVQSMNFSGVEKGWKVLAIRSIGVSSIVGLHTQGLWKLLRRIFELV